MSGCDTRCGPPRCCQLELTLPVVVDDGATVGYAGARLVRIHWRIGLGLWVSLELARRLYPRPLSRWIVVGQ